MRGREGLSATNLKAAAEGSLRRLQTDYIDLSYAHVDDADTPLGETLEALDELRREGKVPYIAASGYSAERLAAQGRSSRTSTSAASRSCARSRRSPPSASCPWRARARLSSSPTSSR